MSDSSLYDDPELTPQDPTFDNITFTQPGDRIHGIISKMEPIDTRYGKVAKYWILDLDRNKSERTMLAGAQDLWAQLHKLRPQVGDTVSIELLEIDGRRHVYSVEVEQELPF